MVVCLQGCGNKFNPNNSINRHKKLVCGKPHHRKSFSYFSMWGNYHHWEDHPQSESKRVGGEQEYGSGQLWEEEDIHNNYILSLLYEENIYVWDSNKKENIKGLPSQQHFKLSSHEERHNNHTSHHLNWTFLLIITVMLTLFLCLFLKKNVQCSQMETDQLTLEAWWINTSGGSLTPFQE